MNISGIERKTLLLVAMLLTCGVASAQVVVKGSVYGGGQGIETDEKAGLVTGNATVTMNGGTVERSIYGGGELGSVGTFTYETVTYPADDPNGNANATVQMPVSCTSGTGVANVSVNGGHVGKNGSLMGVNPDDDDRGWIFCGGRGKADSINYPKAIALGVVGSTHLTFGTIENATPPLVTASVYGGCENGLVLEDTHVEILGGQIGTGLVSKTEGENHVWTGTWDSVYNETKWTNAINAVRSGNASEINAAARQFHECDTWPYGDGNGNYYVYDINAGASGYNSYGGALQGSNGQTFFGNVFGGGSGYYPIRPGVWRRTAGQVNGNTLVEIKGGHILTSVYGGNEMTDVKGSCTVNMTGGTLGVPRTLAQIEAHPVTCYLFGAGKGDQRVLFNKWTNVQNAEVNIGGDAFFFGSVFGGGEDGHVLGDVTVNINNLTSGANNAFIGTWGYSYVDGNVFGGGRGFSGDALTAGSVGGNVELHIGGGTMLGSIYGGGRLASVGTALVNVTIPDPEHPGQTIPNPAYGQMQPGEDHGNVTINITGGTIGNDYESKLHRGNPDLANGHTHGGNVFGGSMGRLTLLDGDTNPLWPNLGKVKNTVVTISGNNTIIKGNVYGGSELGTLAGNASVTIEGGTIWRNVFGGSLGSDNTEDDMYAPLYVNGTEQVMVNPMQRAGRIDGNTNVSITGGWVKKNVYGGGELASVGTITEEPVKHEDETQCFALSWPYEFKYQAKTGIDTVLVTGGRIGLTGKDYMGPWNSDGQPIYYTYDTIKDESGHVIRIDEIMHVYTLSTQASMDSIKAAREDNGDVYGGGKGKAGDRYVMAHCANSSNTVVIIEYPETNTAAPGNYKPDKNSPLCLGTIGEEVYDFVYRFIPTYNYVFPGLSEQWSTYHNRGCLPGSLYGGGENGHVNDSTIVTLKNGLVGHNLYGGGKGNDTYKTMLYVLDENQNPVLDEHGEHVLHEVEITSITAGKVYGNTNVTMNGGYVVRNVFGGGNRASVGKGNYASGPKDFTPQGYGEQWNDDDDEEMQLLFDNSGHTYVNIYGGTVGTVKGMKDGIPTGNVYGSSRGEPAPNVRQNTELTPRINYYPEFFLGYANHTHVVIGKEENGDGPRLYGSVFGGGENGHVRWDATVTVNKGKIGNRYDAATIDSVGTGVLTDYQWRGRGCVFGGGAGLGKFTDNTGDHYSTSAGSVTQFTTVNINGGTIYQNVYGGGPLSSVGPPAMGQETVPSTDYSLAQVNIRSTIGDPEVVKEREYGGNVYGAARGVVDPTDPLLNFDRFSTTMFTEVNLYEGANVPGNVYGGGQLGQVKNDTKVNMMGGTVGTIGYVRKHNTASGAALDSIVHTSGGNVFGGGAGYPRDREAALVKGNTEINISGGHVLFNVYGGGEMASVGLRDSIFDGATHTPEHLIDFAPKASTGYSKVTVTGGQVGPAPKVGTYDEVDYNIPIGLNGVDGYVFGGGKGIGDDATSRYAEFADVNYGSVKVAIPSEADITTNRIWGSIFGGAEDGHVLGSDTVRLVSGLIGTTGTTSYDGNIFGGGRNFSKKNYTAGRTRGNITVEMTGGQLYGTLFGGGRLALTGISKNGVILADTEGQNPETFGHVKVMVKGGKLGNDTPTVVDGVTMPFVESFTKYSMGDVFGGGKGDTLGIYGHPAASALFLSLTKDTEVEISEANSEIPTKIYGSVYGGGEVATVGRFQWDQDPETHAISNIELVSDGLTKVTVSGGQIGLDRMRMHHELASNAANDFNLKYNNDVGHVFGGGKGHVDDPSKYASISTIPYGDIRLLDLLATVDSTVVVIKDDAWVKGSVYGGALSGHVLSGTYVQIKGGQIGSGRTPVNVAEAKYAPNKFFDPITYFQDNPNLHDVAASDTLAECVSWPYGMRVGNDTVYHPFDPVMVKNGVLPSDGKTWFGNVFGGGSGYYPYIKKVGNNYVSQWDPKSGWVGGSTKVEITGGHILTGVYGGCEVASVVGDSTIVVMSGGTVGVPRTIKQKGKHPVTCYLFGGGKGDPRNVFNPLTNVNGVRVELNGGTVYGSAFGGGEEGHVLGSTKLLVKGNAIIGTTGLSGVDGHVYGGGKGDETDYEYIPENGTTPEYHNFTPGRVAGNTKVTMANGRVLGNIFGGGMIARTGVDAEGRFETYVEDGVYDSINHGTTFVKVTGGIIGNNAHDGLDLLNSDNDLGNIYGGGRGKSDDFIEDDWGRVANAVVDISGNPTIYGSVFGGGQMANVGHWNNYDELYTEKTGTTNVTISGTPTIGLEKEFDHTYSIGGYDFMPSWTWYDTINNVRMISHTCTGNVFGGGQGDVEIDFDEGEVVGLEQGHCRTTLVEISGNPTIRSSVFGGSEDGMVWGDTKVKIAGGTIGTMDILSDSLVQSGNTWTVKPLHATYSYGNVFGGSYGKDAIIHLNDDEHEITQAQMDEVNTKAGRIYGKTHVEIAGGAIRGNVFGGSNYGTVVGDAEVVVNGGSVGPLDGTGLNAYVYGGGKGFHEDPRELRKAYANVDNTKVTVEAGTIYGSVFGGGSDAHVLGDAEVTVTGGLLGTTGTTTWDGNIFGGGRNFMASNLTNGRVGGNITVNMKGGTMLGSIFGGGRLANTGIDEDGEMQDGEKHGYVTVNVGDDDEQNTITIGHATNHDDRVGGNVYGGGKGIAGASTSIYPNLAKVKQTEVNIKERTGKQTWIKGSVFGSGEDGHVLQNTYVNIFDGQIGGEEYTTNTAELTPCANFYHGNVYGGGRGVETYTGSDGQQHYSLTAGHVGQNTFVNIYGGRIVRSVYGGGNLSSVGVATDESTGLATVNVLGGSVGFVGESNSSTYAYRDYGNVFGSGHGMVGNDGYEVYKQLAYVKNTHVTIDSVAMIYGSVFGGGEDGHVRQNTLVDVKGGVIGQEVEDFLHGNVYGGGRGIVRNDGYISPTAGEVFGHATVNIMQSERTNSQGKYYTPVVWNNVYGGGSRSVVSDYKVVNMSAGIVHDHVFGGSRDIPAARPNKAPRWVNMWGGTIGGNLYGCSHNSNDAGSESQQPDDWASFINLSGGTIMGNVFGAGYGGDLEGIINYEERGGLVYGSVGILIGKNAIESVYTDDNVHKPESITKGKLDIKGNVYAGASDVYNKSWGQYAVTGSSNIYIDGTGYDTQHNETGATNPELPYMYIGSGTNGGGIYGSGDNCEAGQTGHNILVREYGTRNPNGNPEGEFTQASRSLTTIQRADNVIIDHANVNLSGIKDISNESNVNKYGVMRVSDTLAVINAGGIVLGSSTAGGYAHMDSIYSVQSLNLANSNASIYDHNLNELKKSEWYWLGIQDGVNTAKLYNITGTGTNAHVVGDPLTFAQENVVLYNDTSKLWVRYHDKKDGDAAPKQYYGELLGFFRMRGNRYQPYGTESFAYARPKITDGGPDEDNKADGGFLSYNNDYNFFTDYGDDFTNSEQHPYTNVLYFGKGDRVEYREWVIQDREGRWYVDGRSNGWGNDAYSKTVGAGRFPDKPKKTIFGEVTYSPSNPSGLLGGIVTEQFAADNMNKALNYVYKTDVIYVVGALSPADEKAIVGGTATYTLCDSIGAAPDYTHYPLKLYRYPGGHKMSNGQLDYGTATTPTWGATGNAGPGANYGAMLVMSGDVTKAPSQITLKGVLMDGLYDFTSEDQTQHLINPEELPDEYRFNPSNVTEPMIVAGAGSTLTLNGGTELKRGYNNHDALPTWYTDADYTPTTVHDGGAIFAAHSATVNVSGMVTIKDNWQQKGTGEQVDKVKCNVYLPLFEDCLNITDMLDASTRIGITNPKRNDHANYTHNTLSPVAVANKSDADNASIANNAWTNNNFFDDQGWFFVNGHTPDNDRSSYYSASIANYPSNGLVPANTLFFGWTWANVVRKAPATGDLNGEVTDDFSYSNINSPHDLAWLISKSAGMNGQAAIDFTGASISQTKDIDMQQYVWVPVGTKSNPFKGTYDGKGHLIKNLSIDFVGSGDLRYKRSNYGLFGHVSNGTIDRTFVVSGLVSPEGDVEMELGGLAGTLDGSATISNSEAAVAIESPNSSSNAGGLVGQMLGGTIHSSMAMPDFTLSQYGAVGGLAGITKNSEKATPSIPSIKNSFAQVKFDFPSSTEEKVGGLVGKSESLSLLNNYSHLRQITPATSSNYVSLIAEAERSTTVEYCYGDSYPLVNSSTDIPNNGKYSPVIGSDNLGYMYADNRIENDTALFVRLNKNAMRMNKDPNVNDSTYAHWARPGLAEINGDLPVLLLNEFDEGSSYKYQGSFRSVATYEGGPALQYGGPVRDGENDGKALNELDAAIARLTATDNLMVYGDITVAPTVTPPAGSKISINEHVTIMHPGTLSNFAETYVGITFDNSCGHATSTPGVNYGLVGIGGFLLPRDWHMFSTPLSNAPLGFDYKGDNVANSSHYNNPWVSTSNEFSWLTQAGSDECANGAGNRYWMDSQKDGYFPTQRGSLYTGDAINDLFIVGSDECPSSGNNRYPYGMDFYAWTEPDYHWINFKRNGPNHWHSDEPHDHLEYKTEVATNHLTSTTNVNEDNLISAKGYMASITIPTFMQSHGNLNNGPQSINLTTDGKNLKGWNLVGNPYHGYLDFDAFAEDADNSKLLGTMRVNTNGETTQDVPFYVVYDADSYTDYAISAFRYYPKLGSVNGAYAGRYLHPHQGFYVKANDGGALQFNEDMVATRSVLGNTNDSDGHFRDDDWRPAYPLVNLYLSSDKGCADVTVIEFDRPEWGGAKKLKELRVGDGLFYAQHDDTHYAALFTVEGVERVPLWFEAKDDDIFTIKWNTANAIFHEMYLVDNIAGVRYDMLRNNSYSFEGHKGDYPSRFYITFRFTDVEENQDHPFVFFDGSQWVVTGDGEVEFIDPLGQVLARNRVNGQTRLCLPQVADGVYLFRLIEGKQTKIQKVIVKK